MVTILFVTTAVFAQGNIPTGLQQIMEQNPEYFNGSDNWQNEIPKEFRNESLPVKKSKETVWVQDSIYNYIGSNNVLNLDWREKTLLRNEHGNMTNGISHFWDENNQSWNNRDTTSVTFYDADTENGYLRRSWNSQTNDWTDTTSFVRYNENGQWLSYQSKAWDFIGNSFVWGIQLSISYDENDNLAQELEQDLDINKGDWVNSSLLTHTFDENNHKTGMQQKHWDNDTEEWYFFANDIYTYNENGQETNKSHYLWDNQLEDWEISLQRLSEYDGNGNQILRLTQNWDNEAEDWVNSYQSINFYDENDNRLQSQSQTWDNEIGEWVNSYQYLYTYNENGNYTIYHSQIWNFETGDWTNTWQIIFDFGDNGNITEVLHQSWNDFAEEWTDSGRYDYFYSEFEFNSVTEINSNLIFVYPNPATEKIKVSGNLLLKDANITIYSISGKLMKTTKLTNQYEIGIKDLPEGIYFVEIQTKTGNITKRIIKK